MCNEFKNLIKLTKEVSEPLWLFVMLYCNGDCVEKYQNNDKPIEPLGFNGVSNPESKSFLSQPKTFATPLIRHFWFKIACNHVISVFLAK